MQGQKFFPKFFVLDYPQENTCAFRQVRNGDGAFQYRTGRIEHCMEQHEQQSTAEDTLNQAEYPPHEPVEPAEESDLHDLLEAETEEHDSYINYKEDNQEGDQEAQLLVGNKPAESGRQELMIAAGHQVTDGQGKQEGNLPGKADPYPPGQ